MSLVPPERNRSCAERLPEFGGDYLEGLPVKALTCGTDGFSCQELVDFVIAQIKSNEK